MPPTAVTVPAPRRHEEGDDGPLIDAMVAGSRAAFVRLHDRYRPQLRMYVHSKCKNFDVAEDIVQNVFERAWRNRARFVNQGKPYIGFLQTVARNLVIDFFKSAHNQKSTAIPIEPGDPLLERAGADDDPPAAGALRSETARLVRAALSRLNGEQRRVLELRYLAELTIAEVAVVMERSPAAVKTLAFRASRNLVQDPALRNLLVVIA